MTVVGPDTLLLSFNRGWTGGLLPGNSTGNAPEFFQEVALARINLRFLESDHPYEFTWHFNDGAIDSRAAYNGSSVQDYGYWDQRALARASSPITAAVYVPGAADDAALQLTGVSGSSGVVLSQAYNYAVQMGVDDSFTVQIEMKTSDTSGVLVGTRPTIRNWTLEVVDGKVRFSLFDTQNTAVITSTQVVSDGQWHHIAAVRDASTRQLRLYIDHVEAATAVTDTATFVTPPEATPDPIDPVYLGTYNTLLPSSKLAMIVDTLRITRAALSPAAFFASAAAAPAPPPPPEYPPNAPSSIAGLQFWLPPYDPTLFFSDQGTYSNPLPLVPFTGMATRSMIEKSANELHVQTFNPDRQILYGYDSVMGPYWNHVAQPQAAFGSELWVRHQSGSKANTSFDFVQNTGVFTLSTFLKLGPTTLNNRTIFDTNEGSANRAGFSLMVQQNGLLFLSISGGTGNARFNANAPANTALSQDLWYHIAVVGNGPGNPVRFYVTSVASGTVTSFDSSQLLVGDDGTYTTDYAHEMFIAGRSNKSSAGAAPFNGGLVNEAIFNRALTAAEIQQLFDYGKGLGSGPTWQNQTNQLDVDNNGAIDARDVLAVVNYVLLNPSGQLPTGSPPPFVDVNGSSSVNAQDALIVINWLLLNSAPAAAPASIVTAGAAPAASPLSMVSSDETIATDARRDDAAVAASQVAPAVGSHVPPRGETWRAPDFAPNGSPAKPVASHEHGSPPPECIHAATDDYFGRLARYENDADDSLLSREALRPIRRVRSPGRRGA